MINCIGIRRETKDKTQRRAPLSPAHVRELVHRHRISVIVEPWEQRVFPVREYRRAGALISSDLWDCNIIFGVKEIAPPYLYDAKAHCFFSHTVKGQAYNMPMLQHILRRRITLIDYELVRDASGKRVMFFGDYAGYAGMIDSLWALGRRLTWERVDSPFRSIRYTTEYERLTDAEEALQVVGKRIRTRGLPRALVPLVCAFTGYGRVSKAAQHIYDILPVEDIPAKDIGRFFSAGKFSNRVVYKVQYSKPDMFVHRTRGKRFDASEFARNPERYRGRFHEDLPFFTMVINGIYWEPRFPRLITRGQIRQLYRKERSPRLRVIGDITCDIEGSIELTVKETDATNPVFVFDHRSGDIHDGWEGRGPVVLAVDKLPTELPREASEHFGSSLLPFVPQLALANFGKPLPQVRLPREFRHAVIAHQGELAPGFTHLKRLLPES